MELMEIFRIRNSTPRDSARRSLLARVLGAALEGAPDLQANLVQALGSVDQQRKTQQSQTPAAVLIEALLLLSHSKTPEAYVG